MNATQRIGTGRSAEFADQVGAMSMIASVLLDEDKQDIDLQGLDGEVDGKYFLTVEAIKGGGAVGLIKYFIRPNGSNANCTSVFMFIGAGTITNTGDEILYIQSGSPDGASFSSKITIYPHTGRRRFFDFDSDEFGLPADVPTSFKTTGCGSWNDTSTPLTSILLHADTADGFKAGTLVTLWKINDGEGGTESTGTDLNAWHRDLDLFGSERKIGTADAFDFPFYTNNTERGGWTKDGVFYAGGAAADDPFYTAGQTIAHFRRDQADLSIITLQNAESDSPAQAFYIVLNDLEHTIGLGIYGSNTSTDVALAGEAVLLADGPSMAFGTLADEPLRAIHNSAEIFRVVTVTGPNIITRPVIVSDNTDQPGAPLPNLEVLDVLSITRDFNEIATVSIRNRHTGTASASQFVAINDDPEWGTSNEMAAVVLMTGSEWADFSGGVQPNEACFISSGPTDVRVGPQAEATLHLMTDGTDWLTINKDGDTQLLGSKHGFFGGSAVSKPTVTGVKSSAFETSLMAALSGLGLVTDSTT